jgi:superfamily II DNA helicase RecQ
VDRLRTWRLGQARAQGVPAYVVFNDRTLEAIAALRPTTETGLLEVPGIGPAKLDAYGDQLLDLLAAGGLPDAGRRPGRRGMSTGHGC